LKCSGKLSTQTIVSTHLRIILSIDCQSFSIFLTSNLSMRRSESRAGNEFRLQAMEVFVSSGSSLRTRLSPRHISETKAIRQREEAITTGNVNTGETFAGEARHEGCDKRGLFYAD
jgi:hypothetical protein